MSNKLLHELIEYKITHKEQDKAWKESCKIVNAIRTKSPPYWLTLAGACGVGKTMLGRAIIRCVGGWSQSWRWTDIVNTYLRNGDYGIMDHLADLDLLLIDDIGAEHASAMSNKAIVELMERRIRKWTVITTNLTISAIGDQIDMRAASRIKRGNNVVVNMFRCKDYADI